MGYINPPTLLYFTSAPSDETNKLTVAVVANSLTTVMFYLPLSQLYVIN